MSLNKIVQKIIPSVFVDFYRNNFSSSTKWVGNYSTWNAAKKDSKGYESGDILTKVFDSTLAVSLGKATYERDSFLFYDEDYDLELIALILSVALKNKGKVNVLDFGGALGSTFFKNRKFISSVKNLKWIVVEQPSFVKLGQKNFESKQLSFCKDLNSFSKKNKFNIVLFSSVLQYLENPFEVIKKSVSLNPKYIVVLRTSFTDSKNRIAVQKVNPKIYSATYPCHIFNERYFLDCFKGYKSIHSKTENDYLSGNLYFKSYFLERLK